ncbi:MAG: type II toxin-antitoxin system Phd/YefM family antitoxin [Chloroflexia bacterium]|nr:type II toxin-antitoxin system Phd/YefM family antitoxin [Chloroflexia bacterium]
MALHEKRTTETWSVAEAKAKFSEVVERAKTEGPQRVTKNGRAAVIVVAADEWEQRDVLKESLFDVLQRAQLEEGELVIERRAEPLRDVNL